MPNTEKHLGSFRFDQAILVVVHLPFFMVDAVHGFRNCSTKAILVVVHLPVFMVDAVHGSRNCSTKAILVLTGFLQITNNIDLRWGIFAGSMEDC